MVRHGTVQHKLSENRLNTIKREANWERKRMKETKQKNATNELKRTKEQNRREEEKEAVQKKMVENKRLSGNINYEQTTEAMEEWAKTETATQHGSGTRKSDTEWQRYK